MDATKLYLWLMAGLSHLEVAISEDEQGRPLIGTAPWYLSVSTRLEAGGPWTAPSHHEGRKPGERGIFVPYGREDLRLDNELWERVSAWWPSEEQPTPPEGWSADKDDRIMDRRLALCRAAAQQIHDIQQGTPATGEILVEVKRRGAKNVAAATMTLPGLGDVTSLPAPVEAEYEPDATGKGKRKKRGDEDDTAAYQARMVGSIVGSLNGLAGELRLTAANGRQDARDAGRAEAMEQIYRQDSASARRKIDELETENRRNAPLARASEAVEKLGLSVTTREDFGDLAQQAIAAASAAAISIGASIQSAIEAYGKALIEAERIRQEAETARAREAARAAEAAAAARAQQQQQQTPPPNKGA